MLAGDRNLTLDGSPVRPGLVSLTTNAPVGWSRELHDRQGNVAVGDGSVQQLNEAMLRAMLANTGIATNSLLVP